MTVQKDYVQLILQEIIVVIELLDSMMVADVNQLLNLEYMFDEQGNGGVHHTRAVYTIGIFVL